MERVVVVGASLAGIRAAESVRRHGHDGALVIVGDETHLPYDRPPLSKQVLTGQVPPEALGLDVDDVGAEWMLGARAVGVDLERRRLLLQGGEDVAFDGLVIATGARPRRPPGLGAGKEGVHVLRTIEDAVALRHELEQGPAVAIVGAGFIGAEVASSCRQRGLDVTVVEALPVPLAAAIGEEMGGACARLHRAHGARLVTGTGVEAVVGARRAEGLRLADGSTVAADAVVVAVGVEPEVGWLQGTGVDLDNGVVCDQWCRVTRRGRPLPGVVACGDAARWWHPGWQRRVRLEHWTNAVEQGEAAGAALVRGEEATPYAPVPYFWSDQYRRKIQMVGQYQPGDRVEMADGTADGDRFVAAYRRGGRLVGAVGFGRPAKVMELRRLIAAGAPLPPPPGPSTVESPGQAPETGG